MNIRKLIKLESYYILPLLMLFLSWNWPSKQIFITFGNTALWFLVLVLFIKPLSILIPIKPLKILMTYRRELGLVSFWFFIFHAAGAYIVRNKTIADFTDPSSHLFLAAVSGFGFLVLALTANDLSVRVLGPYWKVLHRIAYLVYILALYHITVVQQDPLKFAVLGGGFIILKMLEYQKMGKL